MSGHCMLPLKFNRRWKYENTWIVFSVVSLVLLPWALALGLVDHLFETYPSLSMFQIAVPFLFGIGWGIAQENPSGSKGTGFSPYIKEAGIMGFRVCVKTEWTI
jgi:L-rhamnose-proton symport protein (RhaT)